jgi:hypothetical protein
MIKYILHQEKFIADKIQISTERKTKNKENISCKHKYEYEKTCILDGI